MSGDHGEIVIEISGQHNRNLLFDPQQVILRGAFDPAGIGPRGKALACGKIPGMRVGVNMRAKKARIFDPLEFPSNEKRLDEINEAFRRANMNQVKPRPQESFDALSDNTLSTWLYWMRRYVEEGKAFHVSGSAKLDSEKLPGDPTIDIGYDSNHKAPRLLSEFDALYHSDGNAKPDRPLIPTEQKPVA